MKVEGWKELRLSDLGRWIGGGTPSKASREFWENGNIPWISPKDMKSPRLTHAEDYITQAAVDNSATNLLAAGAVLIVVRSGILRHSFPVALLQVDAAINQDIKALTPKKDIDSLYVRYILEERSRTILRDCAKVGTTVESIDFNAFRQVVVLVPPLGEQRKIASILSSVDDTIEKTQAVIEKLQIVKKAMMQELLTRGIPGRHTRFKQTEIGELPEGWEVVPLGSILDDIDAGWSPQCEGDPASEDRWGILKVSAVTSGEFRSEENKRLPDDLEPKSEIEVVAGDLIMARANGVLELVGRTVFIWQTRKHLMLSDKLFRLKPSPSRASGIFLHIVLQTDVVRKTLLERVTGSHMRNISQGALKQVRLPLPSLSEQDIISNVLSSLISREREERKFLARLSEIKSALLSVLLTGELRVQPQP